MPAVKALIATRENDKEWLRMRAPVVELDEARVRALASRFESAQGAKAA
jgi:hypothetical protein